MRGALGRFLQALKFLQGVGDERMGRGCPFKQGDRRLDVAMVVQRPGVGNRCACLILRLADAATPFDRVEHLVTECAGPLVGPIQRQDFIEFSQSRVMRRRRERRLGSLHGRLDRPAARGFLLAGATGLINGETCTDRRR